VALWGPIFGLTGFAPEGALRLRQVALEIGFARVAALVLLPMIRMRLFVEEKILFTSRLAIGVNRPSSRVRRMDRPTAR